MKFSQRNAFSLVYALLLGVLPLLVSSSLGYGVAMHEGEIQAFSTAQWTAVFALSAVTMAFALTPTTLVALVAGYFLGFYALPPLVLSYAAASLLGYEAARGLDEGRLLRKLSEKPKVRQLLARVREREFSVVAFARLSPVLPFALTNVLFSFVKVRRENLLLAGLLGMLPRTLLSLWAGTEGRTLRRLLETPDEANVSQWVLLGLIVVSLVGLGYVLRRAWR